MPLTKESLINDFQDCFEGLGTFNMKPYHIALDPKAQPVVHAPRAVPVHLHKMFKDELDQMIEHGVSVKEPTEWVNSIVLRNTTNEDGVVRATHLLVIEHSTIRCDIKILTLTTL